MLIPQSQAAAGSAKSGAALATKVSSQFGIQLRTKEANNQTTDHSSTAISMIFTSMQLKRLLLSF